MTDNHKENENSNAEKCKQGKKFFQSLLRITMLKLILHYECCCVHADAPILASDASHNFSAQNITEQGMYSYKYITVFSYTFIYSTNNEANSQVISTCSFV